MELMYLISFVLVEEAASFRVAASWLNKEIKVHEQ